MTNRLRFEILKRDNFTCMYCGATDGKLEVDHIFPKSKGGTDNPDNLITACRSCNVGKSNMLLDDSRLRRSRVQMALLSEMHRDYWSQFCRGEDLLISGGQPIPGKEYLYNLWVACTEEVRSARGIDRSR